MQLDQLKDRYGNIYELRVKDQVFVFRELTRKEYKRLTETPFASEYESEEAVCRMGVVHPENYDFSQRGRGGLAKMLSAQIIFVSGYADSSQATHLLDMHREEMSSFENQAETVIGLVFPGIDPDSMADWTMDKLARFTARAEWVMTNIWGMDKRFGGDQSSQSETTETPQPDMETMAAEIREAGGDPMTALRPLYHKEKTYMELPLIGGTKLLENEGVLENVREQIQGLPRK